MFDEWKNACSMSARKLRDVTRLAKHISISLLQK